MAFSTVAGSSANDATSYVGTSGVDAIAIANSEGNYFLSSKAEADVLNLVTTGDPNYSTSTSNTTLKGGAGADTFTFSSVNATTIVGQWINANADDDTITFGSGAAGETLLVSTLQGGNGDDTITGTGTTIISSLLNGNKADDTITLTGAVSNSSLFGGQGDDGITATGAVTNTTVAGGVGTDTITFNTAAQSLNGTSIGGGDGIDTITLTLSGAAGTTVFANGNAGTDTLNGTAAGSASLFGGQGIDSITANGAATTIVGGDGLDNIAGGAGVDRFYWTAAGQGETTSFSGTDTAANVQVDGDNITGGAATDFIGVETDLLVGSTAAVATTTQNNWNLNTQGFATMVAGGAITTGASISVVAGTVTGDAGDTAFIAMTSADGAVNDTVLMKVTLGTAHAGTVLGAQDTITVLGNFDHDVVVGTMQLI